MRPVKELLAGFARWRRTRPFWGGLWLALGGYAVIHFAHSPLGLMVGSGWSSSAGYVTGGGMILFAVTGWVAPHYSAMVGLLGVLLALGAFISANLGGFLVGTVLGIIGGSMIWGWGEKKPRHVAGRRAKAPVS